MDERAARSPAALDRRRQGVRESYQCKFIRRDGQPVWAWLAASPMIEEDGSYAGSLAMVTDVSDYVRAEQEREELQAQLNQSQRLETVGKLAGGVAHDFNHLLAVILNYAVLLKGSCRRAPRPRKGSTRSGARPSRGAALTRRLLPSAAATRADRRRSSSAAWSWT